MQIRKAIRHGVEAVLFGCVLLLAFLTWAPVMDGNLLIDWRTSDAGRFTQKIATIGGLIGVLYFAVVAGFRHSHRFDWFKFLLLAFLGITTFGVATAVYYGIEKLRRQENGHSWLPHKTITKSRPGPGVWWSFRAKKWSPRILDALELADSAYVKLAVDGQLAWDAEVDAELRAAAVWTAEKTVEQEKIARSIPDYVTRALSVIQDPVDSETEDSRRQENTEAFLKQTACLWPSNFCTGINATYALHHCILSCLQTDKGHQSVFAAGKWRVLHSTALARCARLGCDLAATHLVDEHKSGNSIVRSIGCPGIDDPDADYEYESDDEVIQVVDQTERYLKAKLFLKMSGNATDPTADPLTIPNQEWLSIVEQLATHDQLAANAISQSMHAEPSM